MRMIQSKYELKIEEIFKNANTGKFSSDSRYANMKKKVVGIFDQIEKNPAMVLSYILGKLHVKACSTQSQIIELIGLSYHPSILSVRRRITNQEVVVELGEACTEVHLCDLFHRDDCLLHRQLADEVGQEHLQILCRLLQAVRRLLLLLLLRGRRK